MDGYHEAKRVRDGRVEVVWCAWSVVRLVDCDDELGWAWHPWHATGLGMGNWGPGLSVRTRTRIRGPYNVVDG
jgi:hypothetical protein